MPFPVLTTIMDSGYKGIFQDEQKFIKTKKQILASLNDELIKAKAGNIYINNDSISFNGGFLRSGVSNLNLLISVKKGQVSVYLKENQLKLKYILDFSNYFLLITLILFSLSGFVMFKESIFDWKLVILVIVFWLLILGINIFSTLFRFERLIERALKKEKR